MLTPEYIQKMIRLELPERELKESLLALTPDKIDLETLKTFVETISATCIEGIPTSSSNEYIDCSGTGGSGISCYNTSTAVAFVLAATGLTVTKFGNRAVSSKSGSFDLLEALGFSPVIPVNELENLLQETNLVFLFAPQVYPSLAQLAGIRKALGVKTIFNYIGPLLNPFQPTYRLMGVSNQAMQNVVADYLSNYVKPQKALIVRTENNLDELSPYSPITLIEVAGDRSNRTIYETTTINKNKAQDTLQSLTPAEGAKALVKLFEGKDNASDYYELVCLNAGAGLYAAQRAGSIEDGCMQAQQLLKDGSVMQKLEQLRRAYARFNKCAC